LSRKSARQSGKFEVLDGTSAVRALLAEIDFGSPADFKRRELPRFGAREARIALEEIKAISRNSWTEPGLAAAGPGF